MSEFFEPLSEELSEVIRKKCNEDPSLVENQVELFREWLNTEKCLAKNFDDNVLRNFVRHCKYDLEAAKKKFELYIVNRAKFETFVAKYNFNEEYFGNMVHRCVSISRYLTPEGYRVGFLRLPEDVVKFDFEKLTHYTLTLLDVLATCDSCAGYKAIYDFQNVTTKILGEINVKLLMGVLHLVFNIEPLHIEAIHFINLPGIPEKILSMLKKLIKIGIVEKIFVHKSLTELKEHFPDSVLPKEYGGSAGSIEEFCETAKNVLLDQDESYRKATDLAYTGPVSQELHDLYGLDDHQRSSLKDLVID
ncbi:hypothetical protein Trydic_g23285 [Trypoxylus dichotomus]